MDLFTLAEFFAATSRSEDVSWIDFVQLDRSSSFSVSLVRRSDAEWKRSNWE